MKTVWALLVVSSEQQSETLRHQRAWAEATAKEKGWRIGRFIEGVASGNEGPRRLSRDLLIEVRATPLEARPAYVLMIRLDRVGRGSIVDSQIFVRDLLGLGTRVFTRDAGEIRLDSAMDELVAAVQMAVARHENDVRRDKAKAVYRRRLAPGQVISNRPPYGLELTPERHYAARAGYERAIRQAFRMSARGVGFMDIVRWLQAHSPPHRYKNGHEYAVRWSDPRLRKMLKNRAYIGLVVDRATWLRAQRTRVMRAVGRVPPCDRKRTEFVLAGVFRCICGRSISCIVNRLPKRDHRYYICRQGWTHDRARYHRADDLEARFLSFLADLENEPTGPRAAPNRAKIQRLDRDLATLRKALVAAGRARARIWDLDDRGHLEPRDLAERLADVNQRKAIVEARLVALVEERTFLQASRDRSAAATALRRGAHAAYVAARLEERPTIARAVAVSLGGLRLTATGRIMVGSRMDAAWLRKRKVAELIGVPRRTLKD
jgi:DNA invertase Pin-like site-specific DNA recombinase